MHNIILDSLSFAYDLSDKDIIKDLTTSFSPGWTGLIGANGCGKSTLLKILAGSLAPTGGIIKGVPGVSAYCEQETINSPPNYSEYCTSYAAEIIESKTLLELHDLCGIPWPGLSEGEKKRFQLGCALARRPDTLFIDEPTNHLDTKNRQFIIKTLAKYRGIGVLVSHDRELLNAVCNRCLFFVGQQIIELSGNYDEALDIFEDKMASLRNQKENIKRKATAITKEIQRIDEVNQGSKNRLSKRHLARHDNDTRERIDRARLTSKDASLSQKKSGLGNKLDILGAALSQLKIEKDYSAPIYFDARDKNMKTLLFLKAQKIPLPNGHKLNLPDIEIKSGTKIGLIGANGVGKSTLLRYLFEKNLIKSQRFLYLTQELGEHDKLILKKRLFDLDKENYTRTLQIFSRLGSDPKQMDKSEKWSAGEARKIAIAMAIVEQVDFMILDEPTNHLDLPSMQNLEKALQDSHLALLIVSHDRIFIEHVCSVVWCINKTAGGDSLLEILI